MKRDMDLIRLLLLRTETGEIPEAMSRYKEAEILYHYDIAIEAGLLVGRVARKSSGDVVAATIQRLTWAGHDFLDAARDERTWQKATQRILKAGGSWTFDLLKEVLVEVAKEMLFPSGTPRT